MVHLLDGTPIQRRSSSVLAASGRFLDQVFAYVVVADDIDEAAL
jgi:hypothetical protein